MSLKYEPASVPQHISAWLHDELPVAASSTRFFLTLVTGPRRSLSLKLSDTRVYEPQIRTGGAHITRPWWLYRGTSHIRNRTRLGPYRRPMPRLLGGS